MSDQEFNYQEVFNSIHEHLNSDIRNYEYYLLIRKELRVAMDVLDLKLESKFGDVPQVKEFLAKL